MDMDDAYGSNTTTPNEFEEGDSYSVERLRMSLAVMIIIDSCLLAMWNVKAFLNSWLRLNLGFLSRIMSLLLKIVSNFI